MEQWEEQWNDKIREMENFFAMDSPSTVGKLHVALDAMNELNLWLDEVDGVSEEQCLLCWKIVEKMRRTEFPERLRM